MDKLTRLLADLVAIPSVNPVASGCSDPALVNEERIAKYIGDLARKEGAEVSFRYEAPHRPTVICRLRSRGARRTVAFAPHTDTVSVAHMTVDPFRPRLKAGRLYGRGACDTKGSCAVMLAAFLRAARENLSSKTRTNILFIGLMGEESGNDGALAYCRGESRLDFVVVGEPTFPHVVYTHKGALWLRLNARGRAAHGSNPQQGDNAIEHVLDAADYLRRQYVPSLDRLQHPILGRSTLNLGQIHGGTQVNIVPERCELWVDHRTLPGLQSHLGICRHLARELHQRGIPVSLERYRDCPPLHTNPALPLVQMFHRAARSILPTSRLGGVAYFTDAAIFARAGTPAIVFGPGHIAQAHTADEWIAVAHLAPAAEICYRFLIAL